MAIFRQFLYTNLDTEIDFMQGLIDLICSLDESITIEDASGNPTTVAAQYADLSTTPDFFLNLGNGVKLEFKRPRASSSGTTDYVINSTNVRFTSGNVIATATAIHSYWLTYLKSDNLIALWIGNYQVTTITETTVSFLKLKTANDSFANVQSNRNVLNYNLVGSDTVVTYSPLFQYAREAGKIDFADHAPFVSGGVKLFDTEEILSCSTVSQWASITLFNGHNYFAISPNALVLIDD